MSNIFSIGSVGNSLIENMNVKPGELEETGNEGIINTEELEDGEIPENFYEEPQNDEASEVGRGLHIDNPNSIQDYISSKKDEDVKNEDDREPSEVHPRQTQEWERELGRWMFPGGDNAGASWKPDNSDDFGHFQPTGEQFIIHIDSDELSDKDSDISFHSLEVVPTPPISESDEFEDFPIAADTEMTEGDEEESLCEEDNWDDEDYDERDSEQK